MKQPSGRDSQKNQSERGHKAGSLVHSRRVTKSAVCLDVPSYNFTTPENRRSDILLVHIISEFRFDTLIVVTFWIALVYFARVA